MIIVETGTTPDENTPPPVRPHINPRHRLGVMLTGVDGSTWDLYDGPVRLLSGATGFGSARPEHRWKTSPAIDGSTWGGARTPHRELTLPVYIHTPSSLEWRDVDAAFFDAIDPAGECTLTVVTPEGRWREIDVRYDDGGDAQLDVDPLLLRYATYALSFVAADPYWHGQSIVRQFMTGEIRDLFPGPPFDINPSNIIGLATVTNPGDVDAWPVWTVDGPFSAFTIGLGDATVEWEGSVTAGQSIVIDMHPRMLTIRDGSGGDRWDGTTKVEFAAIPPGDDVDLGLSLTGATAETRISLQFTPRYRRAW